ncbi:MAG TPA: fibronectin type III domain-containing protein [Candidatus Dormibacteraeota bacterium]|nr:fibronectin type III domain-containing protein [Candidatus Dormibacteraeota bacterium]
MRRRIPGALILAALFWSASPSLVNSLADTSTPGAPTNVSAHAGTLSATVQWMPTGSQATSYTVTSSPRGITATVVGTATSATVTGLAFANRYTFTVAGTNGIGTGPSSTPSNPVTPGAPGGPYHQGVARVLTTADVVAGTGVTFNIGDDRVHAPGLSAVVLNVTASAATVTTAVQLVVRDQVSATVLVAPGTVESSLTVVPVAEQLNPAVVQVTAGQAHVEIDFVGFFTDSRTVGDTSGLLQMIPTTTVLDAPVDAGSSTDIPVLGQGDVPTGQVAGVLLNVAAISPAASGSFELVGAGAADPGTTTLGFAAGQTTANRVIVPVAADGSITLLDRGAAAEARIDILGWFADGSNADAVGALYTSITPTRVVDAAALTAGGSLSVPVWGQGGVPDGSAAGPTTSALLQVTVSNPTGPGSIAMSGTSILDFAAAQTVTGTEVAQLAFPAGTASLKALGASAIVTVDLVAYFSGDLVMPGSTKVLSPTQLAGITSMGADSTITFGPGTQVSPPILINDVIVAGPSAATPSGLLRRVLSISTTADGSTVLGTRQAAVPEAITSFFLDWTLPPSTGAFGMSHGSAPTTVAGPTALTGSNPLPPPPNTSIDPSWPSFFVANPPVGVSFDLSQLDPGLHTGSSIDISDLEVQLRIGLQMNLSQSGKFTMHIGFGVGARAAIDVQLLAQISLLDKKHLLEHFFPVGPPIFIFIGIFIFEFQPGIDFSLEFQVSLAGGLIIHEGLDRYIEVSGGYDGKSFFLDPLTTKNYLAPAQEHNLRPSVQAVFELDAHFDPSVAFYGGVASIDGDLKPFATVTVDPLAPHWWDFALGLCYQTEFQLNLIFFTNDHAFLPICFTLADFQAPGRLLGITITPSPATVARSGTQHFHADIPLSLNGVIWSIAESGGGTLSNMTQFDVDYTAPRTAGTYHLEAASVDDPTSTKEVDITVPADPPGAPINVVAALTTSTSAIVGWTAPPDDGGAPLKTYVVTVSPGGNIATINAPGATATFSGLNPATTYTFTVAAINGAGLTGASGVSNSLTTPPAGPMSVNPKSISFGSVTLGQSSQPQTVVVTADGVPLVISTVSLAGTNPAEFAIQNDLCSGQTLQPGATCSFAVQYIPTQQIVASAAVIIKDSDATSPQTVTLSGSSPVPAVSGVVQVFDIQMVDSQTGYAVEGALGTVVVKTTDGGKTWNRLVLPIFDQVFDAGSGTVRFIDANHGFITAFRRLQPSGQVDFILATSDGGQTWQQINLPSATGPESMWFTDASHGWVLSEVAGPPAPPGSLVNSALVVVNVTTDGGLTWTRHSVPDPIIAGTPGCIGEEANVSVAFTDSLSGWMSAAVLCFAPNLTITSRGALFWTTTDGGTTWTPHQPAGVTEVFDRIQVTGPSQVRQLAVVNVNPTLFEQVLVSSDDGGASFSITPLPAQNVQIADVTFSDSTHAVFVTSDGHVWRTTDDGATWQGNTLPRFASSAGRITSYQYDAVASPDGTNIWVTGSVFYGFTEAGFIEKSSDGGATWTVQLLGSGA